MDEEPQQDGVPIALHWNWMAGEIPNIRDFSLRVDKYLRQRKSPHWKLNERLLRGDRRSSRSFATSITTPEGVASAVPLLLV